jgi:type IV secretory pathway VirJ component
MKSLGAMRGVMTVLALLAIITGAALLERAAWSAVSPPHISTEAMEVEGFGTVDIVHSDHVPRGLVILAADAANADARREDATALASAGLIAVTFDFDAFRASLAKSPPDDECHYVADDLKDMAQAVERKLGLKRYFFPVIGGRGDGAAFAYAALAQAPDNTLGGAISVGFQPVLKSDRPYCFDPALKPAGDGAYALPNDDGLPGPWQVIAGDADRSAITAFLQPIYEAEFVSANDDASTRRALVESALRFGRGGERGASDLPVSIIKPEGPISALAIIVSGDGGWRDIDKSIGEWLSERGVAVVGVDSLRYFWSKKSPGQVAADLALLLDHYGKEFGTTRYALIGYSFGADIMPDVWPLLPKTVRDRVGLVSLLALGLNADFEVTVEGFIGSASAESRPLTPGLVRLPMDRTQCIYGKEDADDKETSCIAPELDRAQRISLEGGHHFDGDYTVVAEAIWKRMQGDAPQPDP